MINTKFITTYIIVIFFVHTYALHKSDESILNVGTVLFASSDLNKERWNRENIEILEARRYFQNILPSPNSIDTLSEDFITDLIQYFNKAFSTVKRETGDPELAEIMEKALSDAVAGFFKVWVLPVTKFAYYGGTVSEENAMKSFEYYEVLKNNLNTDGSGWRTPNDGILDTIAISVIPFSHVPHTRSMKEPCEHIAYYEKYDNGLSFALPHINWNESPSSMFLPLKNESSVLLDSPSSAKALLKYYDIAESCCQSNGVEGCNEFDFKFQEWLSNDVVPHLNDDKLYFALGGVLSLLNKTKDLYEKIADSCIYEFEKTGQKSLFTNFPCMTSRKFIILVVVVFLEIIWCIPTLLYLLCCRKKPSMRKRTQYFLDIFKRRKCNAYDFQTIDRIHKKEDKYNFKTPYDAKRFGKTCQPRMKDNGLKLFQKPRVRNTDVDTQYPSHTSKRSTGQVTESFPDIINTKLSESFTVINEMPQKSSLKKTPLHYNKSSHIQTKPSLSVNKDSEYTSQNESLATVQKVETTITKLVRDRSGSSSKSCLKNLKSHNSDARVDIEVRQKLKELDNQDETNDMCPCTCCLDDDKKIIEVTSKKNKKIEQKRYESDCVKKNINIHLKNPPQSNREASSSRVTKLPKLQTKCCIQKEIRLNKSKGLKLNTGEPLLEIRIDRPAAEITVDITKCSNSSKKNAKPSKIPRRTPLRNANNNCKQDQLNAIQTGKDSCVCTQHVYKAIKKRAADDIIVQKKTVKRNKLNATL